ncbi:hypothetical protein AB0H73_34560 [Streptomyces olivoreticuli]
MSDIGPVAWTTRIGGELVGIPATTGTIRTALPKEQRAVFDSEVGSAPAGRLRLVLVSWVLSLASAGEEGDVVVARLRAGGFVGCTPLGPGAGVV